MPNKIKPSNLKENKHDDEEHKTLKFPQTFTPKSDKILLKLYPDYHELSVEQQIYFLKLTEGIFGYNEQVRNDSLKILTIDYNIKYLAPYLTKFIVQCIHVNLVCTDLTLLIYAVRMTKSLISNPYIEIKLFLHELLPALLSCTLCRRICKYYYDNHWTLRDFSAYVTATICHMHGNFLNNLTKRVINLYLKSIKGNYYPLTTLYGALKGLSSLGDETVITYVIPNLAPIGNILFFILDNRNLLFEDKQQVYEAKHIRDLVINFVSPILFKTRNVHDGGDLYIREFGHFGYLLYIQVKNLERLDYESKNMEIINKF